MTTMTARPLVAHQLTSYKDVTGTCPLVTLDFDRYGKVKFRKVDGMLAKLMKMVEGKREV